jgi:hypothetical protein
LVVGHHDRCRCEQHHAFLIFDFDELSIKGEALVLDEEGVHFAVGAIGAITVFARRLDLDTVPSRLRREVILKESVMPVVRVSGSLLLVRASDSLLEVLEPYDSLTELLTDVVPPTPPLMSPDTTMVTATALLPFEVNRPDLSLGFLS